MPSENATAFDADLRAALEAQLAQMRALQEQTEMKLAELARSEAAAKNQAADVAEQPDLEAAEVAEFDSPSSLPEIRVSERRAAADPPKLDGSSGQSVLGVLKRKLETVSGRNEKSSTAAVESGHSLVASADAIVSIERKLDALTEQLATSPHVSNSVTQEALEQVMHEIVTVIGRHSQSAEQQARSIRADLQAIHNQSVQLAQQLAELSAEPEEEPAPPQLSTPGGLEAAVCGPSLVADPSLAPARHELVSGFLACDRGALGLVGELLLFQAAPPDRMPQVLKDVGEAYYRWRPQAAHATDPFQYAMIEWLTTECEQAGSTNRIELVRPGDRYDVARHHAKSRGLEVTEVHGWVVLRDNGKVYTKAAVDVR
jgi:hypothetical protein